MSKHTIEIELPDGWRPAPGEQPRTCQQGEYLMLDAKAHLAESASTLKYIILERDPNYIDTSTIEYRLEVYRQWLLGQKIEYTYCSKKQWLSTEPIWNWNLYTYRVAPTGNDGNGPFYESGGKRVYVPK